MDFGQETSWYAVQAKPYRESLAAASVAKLDAEVFLPRIKQEQMVCGVARVVTKPLFTGYFFARFCPLLLLDAVRHAHGALRVVGTSRFPIPLDAEVIFAIQDRVQADGFIKLEAKPFQPGDRVAIEQGPLMGWIGKVEREWDDGKRVMILLEAIQRTRILLQRRWLKLAADAV
jgi:transcriptional antiterminator RfaH